MNRKFVVIFTLLLILVNCQTNSSFEERMEIRNSVGILLDKVEINVDLMKIFMASENHLAMLKYSQETEKLLAMTVEIMLDNKPLFGENVDEMITSLTGTRINIIEMGENARAILSKGKSNENL